MIPLVENGEEKEVTEENKLEYLNALAHYRLTKKVSEEIAYFIKGKTALASWMARSFKLLAT